MVFLEKRHCWMGGSSESEGLLACITLRALTNPSVLLLNSSKNSLSSMVGVGLALVATSASGTGLLHLEAFHWVISCSTNLKPSCLDLLASIEPLAQVSQVSYLKRPSIWILWVKIFKWTGCPFAEKRLGYDTTRVQIVLSLFLFLLSQHQFREEKKTSPLKYLDDTVRDWRQSNVAGRCTWRWQKINWNSTTKSTSR